MEFRRQGSTFLPSMEFQQGDGEGQITSVDDLHLSLLIELEKEKIRDDILISEMARRRVFHAQMSRGLLSWAPPATASRRVPLLSGPPPLKETQRKKTILLGKRDGPVADNSDKIQTLPVSSVDKQVYTKDNSIFNNVHQNVRHLGKSDGSAAADSDKTKTLPFVSYGDMHISIKDKPIFNEVHDNVNLLGKQGEGDGDDNTCGSKRKMESPPRSPRVDASNKKPKEDWSCRICQVTCTGSKPFDHHLLGKKHMLKEAALNGQKKNGGRIGILIPKNGILVEEKSMDPSL